MTVTSRSQLIAQAAFAAVSMHAANNDRKYQAKYLSFARSFPTLIHTSGLAQAVAFARAKGAKEREKQDLLNDLSVVLSGTNSSHQFADGNALDNEARSIPCQDYMQLSRLSLQCATWLKRYSEALLKEGTGNDSEAASDAHADTEPEEAKP